VKIGAPSCLPFKLEQNFFGFKPEDQVQLHDALYELLSAGEGRWDWDTIYNLPLHIRKYWILKINKKRNEDAIRIEQEQERIKSKTKSIR